MAVPPVIDPDTIDLTAMLSGEDLQALVMANLDPSEHIALNLAVTQVGVVVDNQGNFYFNPLIPIPAGLFRESRVVVPGAQGGANPYDNVLALPPKVRVIVRLDRVTPEAQAQLRQSVAQQLAHQRSQSPTG